MGCKHRRAMRFSLPTVGPNEKSNKQENKKAQVTVAEVHEKPDCVNSKYISCQSCCSKSCDVFGSVAERNWFAVCDVTGEPCMMCRKPYDLCSCRTYHNPGKKAMYCSPYCWLVKRGSTAGVNFEHQVQWYAEHGRSYDVPRLRELFQKQHAGFQ